MKSIRQNSLNIFIEWPITFSWSNKPWKNFVTSIKISTNSAFARTPIYTIFESIWKFFKYFLFSHSFPKISLYDLPKMKFLNQASSISD